MNIYVSVAHRALFLLRKEELFIQLRIKLVVDDRLLCGDKRRIRIGVRPIADEIKAQLLAVHLVEHFGELVFVVAIFSIRLGDIGVDMIQRDLYHIVDSLYFNIGLLELQLLFDAVHDLFFFFVRQLDTDARGRFTNRPLDFLAVELLEFPIFLYNVYHFLANPLSVNCFFTA